MRQCRITIEQLATLSKGLFLGSVSQEAEVTDAHEAVGQEVEQEAADKFVGLKIRRLFPIAVFAISIAQNDLAVIDSEDTIIGERHAVGVAAEIVENGLGRTERLFRIDDPIFVMGDFDVAVEGSDFPPATSSP